MTPVHTPGGVSSDPPGPPERTFADASTISMETTRVAATSASEGRRVSSHLPGAAFSVRERSARRFSAGSSIVAAGPKATTER